MGEHTGGTESSPGILDNEPGDQILGPLGHVSPLRSVELEATLLDVIEQVGLTVVARLSLVPAAVSSPLPCEPQWLLLFPHHQLQYPHPGGQSLLLAVFPTKNLPYSINKYT